MRRALVLGGGVAGLCAAFGLRDRGFRVELLESRGWLGGRAFSFPDRKGGMLDNGPHVMMGCYDHMRALLRRIGSEGRFEAKRGLTVAYRLPDGRGARLALSGWPTPLAMPWGLLRLPLGAGGRVRALWGLTAVLRGAPASWTLAQWIARHRQTGTPAGFFWQPLCRAVMNAEPEDVSARLFLHTLRRAFTGSASRAAIWAPRGPWQEIVGESAQRQLEREGVEVSLGARVRALECPDERVVGVALSGRQWREVGSGDLVVSALPWHAVSSLMGGGDAGPGAKLAGSPLVSIYFRTADDAAPTDDGSLVALVQGRPFHFLYRTPGAPLGSFSLLAGGCRELDGLTVGEIERRARAQLAGFYRGWDPQCEAEVRVSKEARATFVGSPAALLQRPEPGPIDGGPQNLLLCGDWVDTGLPSTLEGAAVSAQAMLKRVE